MNADTGTRFDFIRRRVAPDHPGTEAIPVVFIAVEHPPHDLPDVPTKLHANGPAPRPVLAEELSR